MRFIAASILNAGDEAVIVGTPAHAAAQRAAGSRK